MEGYAECMSEKPNRTIIRAWARLTRAQGLVLASIERSLKEAGLPPLEWYDVLLEVERAGEAGIRPFELERELLLAQYNLSRLLDRVAKAGLVERRACPEDGRGHRLHITGEGRAVRRRMWPVYAAAIDEALARHLTARDAQVLDDVLGQLIGALAGGRTHAPVR